MHLTTPARETVARGADLRCQQVIAELAGHTRAPDVRTLLTAVDRHLPRTAENEVRAYRQHLAGQVNTYFTRLLPPAGWRFTGWEHTLTPAGVQLWWQDPVGQVLADEIYTGRGELLASSRIQARGQHRFALAQQMFGHRLAGVRLLALGKPHLSELLSSVSPRTPLHQAPFALERTH